MKAVLHLTFIKPSWDSILGSGLCTDVYWSTDTISLVRIGLSSGVAMQKIPAEMRQISEIFFLTFLFVLSVEANGVIRTSWLFFRFLSCLTLLTPLFSFLSWYIYH